MSDSEHSHLRELYQEVIIDHNKHPRHFYEISMPTHHAKGFNPLCGDKLELFLIVKDNLIQDIGFKGTGCAISTASASLMTEALLNKSMTEAKQLFDIFHAVMTQQESPQESSIEKTLPGKLAVLKGVHEFPTRIKCATLAWHTLNAALNQQQNNTVTTETEES